MEKYLIAGLGNPGTKYENTRHNAGFQAVEKLAEKLGARIAENKMEAMVAEVYHEGTKLILAKPQTYMNLSGEAVSKIAAYYDLPAEHVIILCDDINLDPGRLRVRPSGSHGGHNGLKNIETLLGSTGFPRIRIGVGMNEVTDAEGNKHRTDLADHVLAKLSGETKDLIDDAAGRAAEAALLVVTDGVPAAMTRYHG